MRFRAGLVIGFGAGYVLGSKAGRERYQQIVEATRAFRDNPGVQRLTEELGRTANMGKERVTNATSRTVEQVGTSLAEQASKARSFVSGGDNAQAGNGGEGRPAADAPQATPTRGGSPG